MHGEMCQKTPKRKHVLMCLQSYNEGSGPIRCVGLILAGCKSHASKWSPLVGLRLPAPAFIIRPLSKPSTLGKPSHKKLAMYRNTTSSPIHSLHQGCSLVQVQKVIFRFIWEGNAEQNRVTSLGKAVSKAPLPGPSFACLCPLHPYIGT